MKRSVVFAAGAVLAASLTFSGCASFLDAMNQPAQSEPQEAPREPAKPAEKPVEGVWSHPSSGQFYEISGADGSLTMANFSVKGDGSRSYSNTHTTFERGAKRRVDAEHGYLYGYNKNRPGWIAYYYTLSGDNMNVTQCINANGGATWGSLDEAKASADIGRPGVVKMDFTRAE